MAFFSNPKRPSISPCYGRGLPTDIITDDILPRLPIADAVRTSVLSRAWRDLWRSVPDLNLSFSGYNHDLHIAAVDHVLLLRRSSGRPVRRFLLSKNLCLNKPFPQIHRWLAALAGDPDPLRSLTLRFQGSLGAPSPISSRIFSFKNLTHLELCCCDLSDIQEFTGFPHLEILRLKACACPGDEYISDLVASCPLLEKLNIEFVDGGCTYLHIRAPNLRSLVVLGLFDEFVLYDAPLLIEASIGLSDIIDDGDDDDNDDDELCEYSEKKCNLLKAFGQAHHVEKLDLVEFSLHFLGEFGVPERVPNGFKRLRLMRLVVNFAYMDEILTTLCLLRSSPNLEELEITGPSYNQDIDVIGPSHEFWKAQGHLELPMLHDLKLTNIKCKEEELEFIDFLLPKAAQLDLMVIKAKKHGSIDKSKFADLMKCWRTCTRAEIIWTG